ncbi:MAG: DUF1553 domain-containing protein, partial [Burkholderiales bacterium]|nr:DUF1553 domain-containing protein [Burkholderiales bacterium]
RWVYHRSLWTLSGRTRNAVRDLKTKDKEGYAKYQKLEAQLKEFDYLKPKAPGYISAMSELGHADSPPTYVLASGIYDRHLEEVQPGTPALLGDKQPVITPTATSSGRRSALANWIASADNPLTARVFVNRVWSQYFGHGIIETVGDFGKMGAKPSNPQLLDWLAGDFVSSGWDVKHLQRDILLSRTYREASNERADAHAADPENKLLWAFPRQRLDAEEIRDSLIYAAGLLNEKRGGPSVFPPVPKNFNAALNASDFWKTSDDPHDYYRRSVYVFIRRNSPYPLIDTFDGANPNSVHQLREVTTTAPQALALVNNDLVFQWSQALAGRVRKDVGDNESAELDRLYEILYSRAPNKSEKARLTAFLDKQQKISLARIEKGKKVALPEGYGDNPAIEPELDKLYQAAYGRPADHVEKVAFAQFLKTGAKKPIAGAAGADDEAESEAQQADADKLPGSKEAARQARASAFVSLVHAVANSNEFVYRF